MRHRVALLLALVRGPVILLSGCGPDAPTYPIQIRSDFADSALQVVGLIEKAHNHKLELGKDEPPTFAIDRLRTYAHSDVEKDVANKVNGLLTIVNAHSDEYSGCDAKIKDALQSHQWPNSFYPECK